MTRIRLLVWLVALVALVAPPGMTAHAMAPVDRAVMADCRDHPPPPCPDEGTAKHAASACCPLMGGGVAVLLPQAGLDGRRLAASPVPVPVRSLAGRLFTKDPPPPRA